ncbi:MAG: T9SS type A sorting domain-containing protein, partial [Calditrichaeota bacterium]|nr:T9SS type A sorting domain-containing protein [Calditrichota bacterium]
MSGLNPYIKGLLLLIALTGLSGGAVGQETFNFEPISNSLVSVNIYGIEIRDGIAYCADGYGMSVWDLSDPDNPEEMARCQTPGNAVKIALYGDYAYVADTGRGVAIFNIQSPEQPRYLNEIDAVLNNLNSAVNVEIHNDLLLISNARDGLVVASLDEPENPEIVLQGEFDRAANYTDLLIKDDFLYINDHGTRAVLVVDVSDFENPRLETEIRSTRNCFDIDIQENLLAISSWDTLFIHSIEDPTNPELLGYHQTFRSEVILIHEDLIFSCGGDRVWSIDIQNPQQPRLLDAVQTHALMRDFVVCDDFLYGAAQSRGISRIDIRDPNALEINGGVYREYHSSGIAIAGEAAFIYDDQFGLRILDVSDSESPETLGAFEIERDGRAIGNIIYKDDIVYFSSDYRNGNIDSLHIIEVSNLDNPVQLGSMQFAISGGFDFVSDNLYATGNLMKNEDGIITGTMLVIDVSDPTNPHTVFHAADGARDQGDRGHRAVFLGDYMFQRTDIPGQGGFIQDVIVYSLENPAEPELLGRWPADTYKMLAPANGYLFCYLYAGDESEIAVYSVDDPLDPELVGLTRLDPEYDVYPRNFYVEGDLIYCGEFEEGINVISVADPENPQIVGYLRTPGQFRDFEGDGRILYVGDEDNFGIYRFTGELGGGDDNSYPIPIPEGWSFISAPISPEDRNIISVFEPIVGSLIMAKDFNGHFYSPLWEFNDIPFWDYLQGYQVKMSERRSLIISGDPVDDDTPIPIRQGWSFAPYYPDQPMEAEIAFANIEEQLILAKDANGRFYLPEHNFNNMPLLRRGKAYQVRSNADIELVWNIDGEGLASINYKARIPSLFKPITPTDKNMSILVTDLVDEGEIGAFTTSGICVGATAFCNQNKVGLVVWGDDESTEELDGLKEDEAFTLKLWSSTLCAEFDLEPESIIAGSGLIYETNGFAFIAAQDLPLIPDQYYLSQNYPNPFNSTTILPYGLPETSHLSIHIFDISGRLIETLVDSKVEAGYHTAVWDASTVSTGVYLVKMETRIFISVQKVIVV